jgi:hypothetical protein
MMIMIKKITQVKMLLKYINQKAKPLLKLLEKIIIENQKSSKKIKVHDSLKF